MMPPLPTLAEARATLPRLGLDPDVPTLGCCGAPETEMQDCGADSSWVTFDPDQYEQDRKQPDRWSL